MATLKEIERLTSKLERLLNLPKDKLIIRRNYGKLGLSIISKRGPKDITALFSKKDYELALKGMIEGVYLYQDRVKLKRK